MEHIQQFIDKIPIRHNFISLLIITGIIQGFLISAVIAFRTNKKNASLRIFGWHLLIQSIVVLDIYLCYTGLMKYILHFNDSTEPLILAIGPLLYLFFASLLERKSISLKKDWYHFVLPLLYMIINIPYYLQPLEVKLNAYLGAYFPDLGFAEVPEGTTYPYNWIRKEFRWLILISLLFYIIISARIVLRTKRETYKGLRITKYIFTRNTIFLFLCVFVLVLFIFLNFDDDGGDHYIAVFLSLTNFLTLIFMMSESRFFESSWIADKYETSGLNTDHSFMMRSIRDYVENNNYFLQGDVSLKNLSGVLNVPANYISQAINAEEGVNFNEFINHYRIEEAKQRLLNEDYAHLSVVGIGNSVGFKSKSAFYTAFKKHTQTSPASYVSTFKVKKSL